MSTAQRTPTVRYDSGAHDESEPTLIVTEVDANGIPHATADAFRNFIAAWQAVDPNGTWEPANVVEHIDALHYEDEAGECEWHVDGHGGYTLDNFPWWIEQ